MISPTCQWIEKDIHVGTQGLEHLKARGSIRNDIVDGVGGRGQGRRN